MAIEPNKSVEIVQVENGFIVRPNMGGWMQTDESAYKWSGASSDYKVYRSMAELLRFLTDHFSHRAERVPSDPDAVPT